MPDFSNPRFEFTYAKPRIPREPRLFQECSQPMIVGFIKEEFDETGNVILLEDLVSVSHTGEIALGSFGQSADTANKVVAERTLSESKDLYRDCQTSQMRNHVRRA